jgi:hypothetical protein
VHCWWLVENIMQFVMTTGNEKIRSTLLDFLPNFIINNGDKFHSIIDRYEKIINETKLEATAVKQLRNFLCLSSGNVVILKMNSEENHFGHFIVCDNCKLKTIIFPKDKKVDETRRRMALMKSTKGLLVSPDQIRQGKAELNLNVAQILTQPDNIKMEIYQKIPALLNHSKDLQEIMENDFGKSLFDAIFSRNEQLLEQLDVNFNDILRNIENLKFTEDAKTKIFNNCFSAFARILENFAFVEDENPQHLMVNLAFTFVSNVPTEQNQVKCFKVFMLFIVQQSSQIMGKAANLALDMARQNNITLDQLIVWHRTFLINHIVHMCISNFFTYKTSLLNSLTNVSIAGDSRELQRTFFSPTVHATHQHSTHTRLSPPESPPHRRNRASKSDFVQAANGCFGAAL